VVLATTIVPQPHAAAVRSLPPEVVTGSEPAAGEQLSRLAVYREQRVALASELQAGEWLAQLQDERAARQAREEAAARAVAAAAAAAAAERAARNNHPAPPPEIEKAIRDAFAPLGADAIEWAERVAWCESRYHPNSVNSSSGAAGLFQFLPSTWAFTPWAGYSPFDPVINSRAAAWLYNRSGPNQWVCQ